MHSILIVDDEAGIRDSLAGILGDEGYSASSADSGATWMVIGALLWISDLIAFLAVGYYDLRVGHSLV